eukprot:g31668.t1
MSDYHRQLARVGVARVRRDFRQQLSALQRSLERRGAEGSIGDASVAQGDCPLSAAVLTHLREVEKFMTAIYRFFKCVDISGQGDLERPDSGEGVGPETKGGAEPEPYRSHGGWKR